MDKEAVAANVFFEEPFWVGVFECISNKVESRNPKRVLREAHKQTQNTGIGTKRSRGAASV